MPGMSGLEFINKALDNELKNTSYYILTGGAS